MDWLLSNIVVTLERYYNVAPGLQEAAAKKFDDMVSKHPEKQFV
jgi:hypothetical protein